MSASVAGQGVPGLIAVAGVSGASVAEGASAQPERARPISEAKEALIFMGGVIYGFVSSARSAEYFSRRTSRRAVSCASVPRMSQ